MSYGSPSFSEERGIKGVCFTDQGRQKAECTCLDEAGIFDPERRYGEDQLCASLNEHERAELTSEPETTGSITPPEEPIGPTEPPGQPPPGANPQQDNGIGNGIDLAPGRSDVTNGDVADGADSGGPNPEGSFTDGTAANGRPAGETNNPNADSTNTNTAAADRGNSDSAPGQNKD